MADYGTLPTTQIDADSPIIEDTMLKLRDNPLAIAEGAPNAPRNSPLSLQNFSPGNYREGQAVENFLGSADDTSWAKVGELIMPRPGTIRTKVTIQNTSSNHVAYARVYLNGVAYGTQRSVSGSGTSSWTEDLAVLTNDLIQIYRRVSSGTGTTNMWTWLDIGVSNPYGATETI